MAQSSWPSPDAARVVDDAQYERLATSYGPRAGVVGDITTPRLVYADSTGLQVKVRNGVYALVSGFQWYSGGVDVSLAIAANSSGSARIDLVVLRLNRSTWNVTLEVLAGAAGSGVAPAPTQTVASTGLWELPL